MSNFQFWRVIVKPLGAPPKWSEGLRFPLEVSQ